VVEIESLDELGTIQAIGQEYAFLIDQQRVKQRWKTRDRDEKLDFRIGARYINRALHHAFGLY
jgi:hypothetical protein